VPAHTEGREGNLSVETQIRSLMMSGPLNGLRMRQLLATPCVTSSLTLVALGGSDPNTNRVSEDPVSPAPTGGGICHGVHDIL
jgi:hypothetical protein